MAHQRTTKNFLKHYEKVDITNQSFIYEAWRNTTHTTNKEYNQILHGPIQKNNADENFKHWTGVELTLGNLHELVSLLENFNDG